MSSRLTTDDELVAWAAHLPGSEWRRLTNTVAWLHRRRDMTERDVPAGLSSVRAPLAEGTPVFELLRNGSTVAAVRSGFAVNNRIVYQDMLYRSGASTRALVAPQ